MMPYSYLENIVSGIRMNMWLLFHHEYRYKLEETIIKIMRGPKIIIVWYNNSLKDVGFLHVSPYG